MEVLDAHDNRRYDIEELLVQILGADIDVSSETVCAHCFRKRRQKRCCTHCDADIARIRNFEHSSDGFIALVPSLIICSMLKSDGYLNVVRETKNKPGKMPFDRSLKLLTSKLNLSEEWSILQSSLRYNKTEAFQLLEMSAICINETSVVCPYFFSKQLIKAVFKNDVHLRLETYGKNEEIFDELIQKQDSGCDNDHECSSANTLESVQTHEPQALSLDYLKSCMSLGGHQDKTAPAPYFSYFFREVVLYKKRAFIDPTHREFFDKYTATFEDTTSINKSVGSDAMEMMLKSVCWIQFISTIVPPKYATCSENAYMYICTCLIHTVDEAYDYFNAMVA